MRGKTVADKNRSVPEGLAWVHGVHALSYEGIWLCHVVWHGRKARLIQECLNGGEEELGEYRTIKDAKVAAEAWALETGIPEAKIWLRRGERELQRLFRAIAAQ